MMRLHRRQPRTGSILPLIVIGIIALLGMIALAVDIGMVAVARTQAQDIADLSALAGARQFNGDTSNASNLNNVNGATAAAYASADDNSILGRVVTNPMISLRTGIYTYDAVQQRFVASYPGNPGSNAWSIMDVTLTTTTPTYFGRVFGINSFNVTANATAAHRPRDLALVLDFSGSMKFGTETAFYINGGGNLAGSLNPDPLYPKFGHYYAMSQRPLASVATAPTSNGTGYNPMQRPILFQDPGGETHAANNLTTSTGGGPPVVQDFLTSTANGRVNAFYQPQSGGAYNPNQQPVAMPAPDNFQDQSDTPVTYVGDKWPRMNKQTSGNNWAVTVQDYLTGSNAPLSNTHTANATFEAKNDTGGYGAAFKGYSMGPAYYGKTFWMWPPDPRFGGGTQAPDPTKISPTDPKKDIYGNYLCDWRKRFFTYPGASTPMDDNSRLFDASGFFQQPSGTTYAVNYKAILAWLKSGPQVLPPNLHAGRVSYYTSIPSDIPTSGGTLDQVFWKNYIDTALGINSTYRGQRSLFGRETAGWGTVKITAKSSLLNGGNPNGPPNTVPYMQYNDNPIRPRAHFWFGPMTMLMFLSTDSEGSPNMWPGTCHESHCWQLKAGINSAIDDVRNNHPNDWACEIFFSSIDSYATPRVTMGRNYTRMKNALFFPFTLLDSLGDDTAEYVPYNSSFSYLGSGTVPNADGGTCPEMAFKVAYSQFSGGNGGAGRRGAAKVVVFETDGVPNTTGPGNFVNGGPYRSYYTGISAGSYLGNNNATVTSQAITAVQQICALDTAASPGYSTTRMPARVHAIAFGDLFETNQTQEQNALAFLLNVQKSGNTSAPGDSSIEPYKIITGDYNTRIDRIRQALERIMQSGVQVSLIK